MTATPPNDHDPVADAVATHLGELGSSIDATPRWNDLADRVESSRTRRRTQLVAGSVVLAAVAGAAGFGIGHTSGGGSLTLASERKAERTSERAGARERAPETTIAPMAGAMSPYGGSPATEVIVKRANAAGVRIIAASTSGTFMADPMEQSGVALVIPAQCQGTGLVTLGLSSDDAVAIGGVSRFGGTEPLVSVDMADGVGGRFVVVTVDHADGTVAVEFPDGSGDSMEATNGFAVFAVDVPLSASAELAAFRDVKVTVAGTPVPVRQTNLYALNGTDAGLSEGNIVPDCSPNLPQPGEQPADPAGAEAEIRATMQSVYSSSDPAVRTAGVDDPAGIAEALERVKGGAFAGAIDRTTATISELVFTDPTTAAFEYSLTVAVEVGADPTLLAGRFGKAVLQDGSWRITRATVCADMAMGGGYCDGMSSPDGPSPTTTAVAVP